MLSKGNSNIIVCMNCMPINKSCQEYCKGLQLYNHRCNATASTSSQTLRKHEALTSSSLSCCSKSSSNVLAEDAPPETNMTHITGQEHLESQIKIASTSSRKNTKGQLPQIY